MSSPDPRVAAFIGKGVAKGKESRKCLARGEEVWEAELPGRFRSTESKDWLWDEEKAAPVGGSKKDWNLDYHQTGKVYHEVLRAQTLD